MILPMQNTTNKIRPYIQLILINKKLTENTSFASPRLRHLWNSKNKIIIKCTQVRIFLIRVIIERSLIVSNVLYLEKKIVVRQKYEFHPIHY